jgi:hypothetical protein
MLQAEKLAVEVRLLVKNSSSSRSSSSSSSNSNSNSNSSSSSSSWWLVSQSIIAVAGGREQLRNPEEGEHAPLEAFTRRPKTKQAGKP